MKNGNVVETEGRYEAMKSGLSPLIAIGWFAVAIGFVLLGGGVVTGSRS